MVCCVLGQLVALGKVGTSFSQHILLSKVRVLTQPHWPQRSL